MANERVSRGYGSLHARVRNKFTNLTILGSIPGGTSRAGRQSSRATSLVGVARFRLPHGTRLGICLLPRPFFPNGTDPMRVFGPREVSEAIAYSVEGGVALHLHRIIPDRRTAPRCFVQAIDRNEFIAHLFALDVLRLRAAASAFGIRVVHIDREGTDRQHLDVCGAPLRRAFASLDADQKPKLAKLLATLPSTATLFS